MNLKQKVITKPQIACQVCGCRVGLIWGDEVKWTGRCDTCGTIYMFITKEDLL